MAKKIFLFRFRLGARIDFDSAHFGIALLLAVAIVRPCLSFKLIIAIDPNSLSEIKGPYTEISPENSVFCRLEKRPGAVISSGRPHEA